MQGKYFPAILSLWPPRNLEVFSLSPQRASLYHIPFSRPSPVWVEIQPENHLSAQGPRAQVRGNRGIRCATKKVASGEEMASETRGQAQGCQPVLGWSEA